MATSKREYAIKVGEYGDQLIKAANKYADYAGTASFTTEDEFDKFRKGWLLIVDDFRMIQSGINRLEVPNGHEEKGKELREAYQKYVDYIEEKTMKFGVSSKEEIDRIQRLELEQSKNIKKITEELKKEMFD